jgi:hypothetical protein
MSTRALVHHKSSRKKKLWLSKSLKFTYDGHINENLCGDESIYLGGGIYS